MATGFRIFVVGDDGSVRPIPVARYEALVRREERGSLSEYAGRRVRAAIVSVELVSRRPVAVKAVEYDIWYLDKQGLLSEHHEELLVEAVLRSDRREPFRHLRRETGRETAVHP